MALVVNIFVLHVLGKVCRSSAHVWLRHSLVLGVPPNMLERQVLIEKIGDVRNRTQKLSVHDHEKCYF